MKSPSPGRNSLLRNAPDKAICVVPNHSYFIFVLIGAGVCQRVMGGGGGVPACCATVDGRRRRVETSEEEDVLGPLDQHWTITISPPGKRVWIVRSGSSDPD
jgi:hypothetical protein